MNRKEVIELLTRIKAHYKDFNDDDYVINEWLRYLKDYDKDDVQRKFEEHLKGEYAQYEPKLSFLIKYLKTTKEKKQNGHALVQCKFCDDYVGLDEFDKHYERCMRINYIERKKEKYHLNLQSNLYSMSIEEIDKVYYKILEHIKGKIKDEKEANAVNKILEEFN